MRRLFRAGLVGASAQILAVTAATVAVAIALRCGLGYRRQARQNWSCNLQSVSWCGSISSWLSALRSRETGSSTRPPGEFVKQPDAFIPLRPIMHAKLFSFSYRPLPPVLPFLLFARPPGF